MIITDAGPLIAILCRDDQHHESCANALHTISYPLASTWPVYSEAMHLLGLHLGWHGQDQLWKLVQQGHLVLRDLNDASHVQRMFDLMKRYRNVPMDLGDASLIVLAEVMDTTTIFTTDNDFLIYRMKNRRSFRPVPLTF